MRVLHNPDVSSGPQAQIPSQSSHRAPYQSSDQQGFYMYPAAVPPGAQGAQAPINIQTTSVDRPQQFHVTQTDRQQYDSVNPHRNDSLQAEYFPQQSRQQTTRLAQYQTYLQDTPDQQRGPASGMNQGWTSRSGIPQTYNIAAQSWPPQGYGDAPQQQQTGQQHSYQTPPGLSRPNFAHLDFPTPNPTPGIYTPRTPHDYSPLPTPIARPRSGPYGEPGPSSVIASAARRRSSGKDEFDGPHQFLPKPEDAHLEVGENQLIPLTISLQAEEQDDVLTKVNDCLSKCAFDFVAKYQFPIPIEADKRPVRVPGDREWTEWCHLLKRLATKRRIPMRVLWNGQIKQLVTVLENSLEMRHAAKHQSRPLKDDRNILQLISAGLQVSKILKDPKAMMFLDELYVQTERTIRNRVGSE